MRGLDQNLYVNKKVDNSTNKLDGSLLYQWKDFLWINHKLTNLSAHASPFLFEIYE